MDLTCISLFSGIGGDTLAAQWAGFRTLLFVEWDRFCKAVLRKHWPNIPIHGDIDDFDARPYRGTVTLVHGGDPCQPNSIAGKRKGKEDDRYKWPQMLRVIHECQPTWVVSENPTGRLSMDFYEVLSDLEGEGYETSSFVIPACAVNAWHRRDRLFIIAHSKKIHGECSNQNQPQSFELVESRRLLEGMSYPRDFRTIHGVLSELDKHRVASLGNAQVPQQIYPIFKGIAGIENGLTRDN